MPARKPEQEKEVLDWIGDVLGEPVPAGDFEEVSAASNIKRVTFNIIFLFKKRLELNISQLLQVLKNGVILCKLMNKISPGAVPKFKEKGMPFILMENIQSFLVRFFVNEFLTI